jgi:hypothetical protein
VTGRMWPSAEGMSFITGLGEGTAYSYPLTLATGRPEFLLLYVVIPPLRAAQAYCSRLRLESHGKN